MPLYYPEQEGEDPTLGVSDEDTFDDVAPQPDGDGKSIEDRILDSYDYLGSQVKRSTDALRERGENIDELYDELINVYRKSGDIRSDAVKESLRRYRDDAEARVESVQSQIMSGLPFLGVDLLGALTGVQMDTRPKDSFIQGLFEESKLAEKNVQSLRERLASAPVEAAESQIKTAEQILSTELAKESGGMQRDQQLLDNEYKAFELETARLREQGSINKQQSELYMKMLEDAEKRRLKLGEYGIKIAQAANARQERLAFDGELDVLVGQRNKAVEELAILEGAMTDLQVIEKTAKQQPAGKDRDEYKADRLRQIARRGGPLSEIITEAKVDAVMQGNNISLEIQQLVDAARDGAAEVLKGHEITTRSIRDDIRAKEELKANFTTDSEAKKWDVTLQELIDQGVIGDITSSKESINFDPAHLPEGFEAFFNSLLPSAGTTGMEFRSKQSTTESQRGPAQQRKRKNVWD